MPEAGGVSFRRLVDSFLRVCECVGFAHVRGVVHRDLKPHNVMLGPFGEVLVLDWGLARIGQQVDAEVRAPSTTRGEDQALMSQAGSIAGTAGYMSPEQAAGEIELGPPADVYALGMILREILTGKPPSLPERMGVLAAQAEPERQPHALHAREPDQPGGERAARHLVAQHEQDGERGHGEVATGLLRALCEEHDRGVAHGDAVSGLLAEATTHAQRSGSRKAGPRSLLN
mgnify:CR=1 FL=1